MPPVRLCECGCGKEITRITTKRGRFFSSECRERKRNATRIRELQRPFVALDGEGIQSRYVLLAASNGQSIATLKNGLSTEECLDFLLSLPQSRSGYTRPIYVWFAMDYDVNMILGDLELKNVRDTNSGKSESQSDPDPLGTDCGTIEDLRAANRVEWRGYRITYFKRKIFRVSSGGRTFTSYDLWSFFGSSFENALKEWGIEVPEIISEGKAARGSFDKWPMHKLQSYNNAELKLLVQLAEVLRNSTKPLGLNVRSWHGPGSLAGSWLGKNRVNRYMRGEIPKTLYEVATRAYFGGRIDAQGYGICDPVYHYDIVSAYPAAIAELPNLTKLVWKRLRKDPQVQSTKDIGGIFVARISWEIPATRFWGPFPWRSRNGTIRYPLSGEGWYWYPEILSAFQRYPKECFTVKEIWYSQGFIESPLHNLIHETFAYRKELKKSGNPAHHSTKLILNSLYGKFAQTVGKARYYNPIWAGLITSHTRAQLLNVITDQTVCIMTDSIWSQTPLDVDLSKELGGWEVQEENRLVLAEAGLYEAIDQEGGKSIWQRGFDKDTPVDIEGLVNHWLYDDPTFSPEYLVHRFVGMGLASVTSHPWRNWVDINRTIHPVPLTGTTKRLPLYPVDVEQEPTDFVRLQLRPRDELELSYPYAKTTLDEDLILRGLEDEAEE